ncbi:MAG: type III pantothenate kinase [Gammaproteobacteria bacterium]|nr:type III pantothenate kinase [Gammaproteobacteria bacterium]
MILLVDIGNSRIKWRLLEANVLSSEESLFLGQKIQNSLFDRAWQDFPQAPERVLVANVAGKAAASALTHWVVEHWNCRCDFVRSSAQACGVSNGYMEAAQLGADRWAALIGAWHQVNGAACIVDCGTALTIDVLDNHGQHQGGLIVPGLELMGTALNRGAQAISFQAETMEGGLKDLGHSTSECINSGILHSASGLVERVMRDLKSQTGESPACLVMGGDGPRLVAELSVSCQSVPELIFNGLALLAQEEVK